MHTSCFSCLDGHPNAYCEDGRWCLSAPLPVAIRVNVRHFPSLAHPPIDAPSVQEHTGIIILLNTPTEAVREETQTYYAQRNYRDQIAP